jgi:type IV pilus assembly protein PilA
MNGEGSSVADNPGSGVEGTTPPSAPGGGRVPVFVWVLIGVLAFFFLCIILLLALLAFPTLGHMKNQASETAAIRTMRTIEQAELMYSETYPSHGYACSLRTLGGDPSAGPPAAEAAQVLPGDLASGTTSEYVFNISNCTRVSQNGRERVIGYTIIAVPRTVGKTGIRGFCSDESGAIKYDPAGGSNCTQPLELR